MGFSRLFLSLGAFVLSTGAWKLDTDSCGGRDEGLGANLRSSMGDAFDVVSGALDELQKETRSSEVNRLLELLFCPEGTAGDQYDVSHLVGTFQGIGAMSQEVEGPDKYENKDDFVLFCNGDRLEENKDKKGWWKDTYSGGEMHDPCTKTGATDPTLAETYQMDNLQGFPIAGEPCDQLQLCPWFLDWYKAQTFKTWDDISSTKAKIANWAIPKLSGVDENKNKWWAPLTPIDGTALFTKVIVHEMTHMRLGGATMPPRDRVGRTEDVKMKAGQGLRIPGGMWDVAYGWTAAKRLAKANKAWIEEDTEDWDMVRHPHLNADSIALFASATRLLRDDLKLRVKDNGELEDLATQAKRYRSVPEVVEGFVKRARAEQQQQQQHNSAVAI